MYVWRGALLGSALKGAKQAFSPPDIILRSIVQTIEQAILGWANGVWLGCMWRGERCAYELRVELRAPARVRTGACQRVRVPWGTGDGARQLTDSNPFYFNLRRRPADHRPTPVIPPEPQGRACVIQAAGAPVFTS